MAQILVVDDDPLIFKLIQRKLSDAGYVVHGAENGQKALEFLSTEHIDLVITDVMMPVLDGWAFIFQLRVRPEYAFLPVIFLTALDSADDRIQGFRLGADDYLAKPFKAEELLLRVERTLRNGERIHRQAQSSVVQPAGFEGTLDQVGFSSLLVLLEMERKTGELVLNRKEEKGKLQLREGRIMNAAVTGASVPPEASSGPECIYYLLHWCEGRFQFIPRQIAAEDSIRTTTTALLMEGARRVDEHRKR
jgi:DNA-binding response OmpR family regulator